MSKVYVVLATGPAIGARIIGGGYSDSLDSAKELAHQAFLSLATTMERTGLLAVVADDAMTMSLYRVLSMKIELVRVEVKELESF